MLLNNKIIFLSVLFFISAALSNADVFIITDGGTSPVSSASQDLQDALQRIFPDDRFVLRNDCCGALPEKDYIKIITSNVGQPESFRIQYDENGIKIIGSDFLGTVYGIYALLEQYNCGFFLTYDTFPAPIKGKWRKPESSEKVNTEKTASVFEDKPLIKDRISFNWHNFLSGCSGWDLPQWKSWLDQCRKLRYNTIMVHAYGNNPMFTFSFHEIEKEAGFIANTVRGRDWGTPHVNDVRRMTGGEHFSGAIFGAPQSLVPLEQRIETVQSMMKKVFAYAKKQGMKIAFQIDVDTPSANPQEMLDILPDSAKIKVNNSVRPVPDSQEGKEFYAAILKQLLSLYPEIDSVIVCTRTEPQPGGYDVKDFPEHWQKEYQSIIEKNKDRNISNPKQLAAYFWTGKVAAAFQDILQNIQKEIPKETGHPKVSVGQASWNFEPWLHYADVCSPKDIAFYPLDWKVVQDNSEFDSEEDIQWVKHLTDSGRRIVPIIWSHHDDGHYIGRTYTPYKDFATHLEKAGCSSFGIIHWVLRPHDLFFKSHSVQVWQSTKNQPLEETCKTAAGCIFGIGNNDAENKDIGGKYLFQWIHDAPMFGRDTSDYMIDRPFTAERCSQVEKESKDRLELLQKIKPQADIPESEKHLAYWKGLETFIQSFWKNETLLQQSVLFLKKGDKNAAIEILKVNPKETVELYANYASQLGILQGDRGLLTLMNLKWLPAFTGLQQQLGLEEYRINFAPTQHEPLAQGPGHRTFFITSDKQPYLVLGKTESGGEEWVLPDNAELIMKNVKENEKEIYRSGIVWKESVKILVVPAMASKFAPKNVSIPAGKRVLRIFSADPSLKQGESKEVLLSLYENKKDSRQVLVLGKCKTEYNTAAEFKFDIPAGLPTDLVLSAEPQQGSVSLCGLVME